LLLPFCRAAVQPYSCAVDTTIGCYTDFTTGLRALEHIGQEVDSAPMTLEYCAYLCALFNYSLNAVEYSYQCFCGNDWNPDYIPEERPMSECQKKRCSGDVTEWCGDANRMIVYTAKCSGTRIPHGHACVDDYSASLPFCDASLPKEIRIQNIIDQLTLDEKLGLIGPDPLYNTCAFRDFGVPRLGIPSYTHLMEVNTAVASSCVAQDHCVTTFAAPATLAATFNSTVWRRKGEVIGSEIRALNNIDWHRAVGPIPTIRIGLEGYGPNINLIRDPRFGRNCELPSEDPLLTASYASGYVKGCQDGEDSRYKQMISGLKHYYMYSLENTGQDRSAFNALVSQFDMWDSELPGFKGGFVDGGAMMAMCAYSSVNGLPSCANTYLINGIIRGEWKKGDVLVGTDCGAISNMVSANKYASDGADAAAKTLNAGADQELGDTYFTLGSLRHAIELGYTDEEHVDRAVYRSLNTRFLTGQFDPLDYQVYTTYGVEQLNSTWHQQINYEGTVQGLVLLRNENKTLPLTAGIKLAVVGPHSVSRHGLLEDYAGDEQCFSGGDYCISSIGEMMASVNKNGETAVFKGVDINSDDKSGISAALDAVAASDVTILCVGIDTTIEYETHDRTTITLPGLQESFAQQVFSTAGTKPVIVIVVSGGVVAIDTLISPASAIIQAFYPSTMGALALSRSVFGLENRWGKLPVTMYASNFVNEISMTDYHFSTGIGRTYRYYSGTPLFEFGTGLSYVTFAMSCSCSSSKLPSAVTCTVTNTDPKMKGDEVLMLFHRAPENLSSKVTHPIPKKQLVGFERVTINPGSNSQVKFVITEKMLQLNNWEGIPVLYAGTHYFDVWRGNGAIWTALISV